MVKHVVGFIFYNIILVIPQYGSSLGQRSTQDNFNKTTFCDVKDVSLDCGDDIIAVQSAVFAYNESCVNVCCDSDSSHCLEPADTSEIQTIRLECSGESSCTIDLGGVRQFCSVGAKSPSYVTVSYQCIHDSDDDDDKKVTNKDSGDLDYWITAIVVIVGVVIVVVSFTILVQFQKKHEAVYPNNAINYVYNGDGGGSLHRCVSGSAHRGVNGVKELQIKTPLPAIPKLPEARVPVHSEGKPVQLFNITAPDKPARQLEPIKFG